MITLNFAYNKLKNRLGCKLIIVDGFELRDAYIFSVAEKDTLATGFPFFSVLKKDGTIGGYNPIINLEECQYAMANKPIDIEALESKSSQY